MANQERLILSEKTLLPLSVVGILAGAIVWATTFYNQGVAQGEEIRSIKEQQTQYSKDLMDVKNDLAYIRGILEIHYGR